ncbi:DC1 [Dillenia turbinata]|uniref:DC1 n=1 Tax=Dillenia turbinata TaxID=194707 RepID=A0AAN8ZJE7_9MAGN
MDKKRGSSSSDCCNDGGTLPREDSTLPITSHSKHSYRRRHHSIVFNPAGFGPQHCHQLATLRFRSATAFICFNGLPPGYCGLQNTSQPQDDGGESTRFRYSGQHFPKLVVDTESFLSEQASAVLQFIDSVAPTVSSGTPTPKTQINDFQEEEVKAEEKDEICLQIQSCPLDHPLILSDNYDAYKYICLRCFESIVGYVRFECKACGRLSTSVTAVYFKRCWDPFHLKCALSPASVEHKCHEHPLILTASHCGGGSSTSGENTCDVCKTQRNPKHWVYACKQCNFVAHMSCVTPHQMDIVLEYPYGRKQTLHLELDSPNTYTQQNCVVCRGNLQGFCYRSDDYSLHPSACGYYDEGWQDRIRYKCWECRLEFHVCCVFAPPVSAQKCASNHYLKLTCLPGGENDDSSQPYFCDVCEEERYPDQWVYFCDTCDFVAHLECGTPAIRAMISQECKKIYWERQRCSSNFLGYYFKNFGNRVPA